MSVRAEQGGVDSAASIVLKGGLIRRNNNGQFWYEGTIKDKNVLSSQRNENKKMEVIIQYRSEFNYPFFIDFY